ncbi:MAG: carbohydrate ABC transporter permease [Acidobacteria bacterium]|nr:carbohydrate ABC transporter permease [Spirochaetota bacterium]MBE3131795.1 carbohydrate ABC transporter permease [Acidobacteriota bacterium]
MIAAAVVYIYPALFVLNNAVKPEAAIKLHPISLPATITFENFAKAWTEMKFLSTLANTAIIMVPIVGLSTDLNLASIWGIIPMYWGIGAPLAVFMYHGFVKGVPRELEEAASIDGAGQFFAFFRVVFPLLKPITATILILDALWLWNDFLLPLVVVRQGTLQLEQLHFYGMFLREYGPAAASLILSAAPIIVLYLLLQKYIIKGIAAGAVKG